MLEVLLSLHTEKTSQDQTKTIINEKDKDGMTVLHHLIKRNGGKNSANSVTPDCLPHINVLLRFGADPEIKGMVPVATYVVQEPEKNWKSQKEEYKIELSAMELALRSYSIPEGIQKKDDFQYRNCEKLAFVKKKGLYEATYDMY